MKSKLDKNHPLIVGRTYKYVDYSTLGKYMSGKTAILENADLDTDEVELRFVDTRFWWKGTVSMFNHHWMIL